MLSLTSYGFQNNKLDDLCRCGRCRVGGSLFKMMTKNVPQAPCELYLNLLDLAFAEGRAAVAQKLHSVSVPLTSAGPLSPVCAHPSVGVPLVGLIGGGMISGRRPAASSVGEPPSTQGPDLARDGDLRRERSGPDARSSVPGTRRSGKDADRLECVDYLGIASKN